MIDPAERLTEDDRGQAASEQWLARALLNQQARAAMVKDSLTPGVCRNCGEACEGHFCDEDCRVDAERRGGRG